MGEKVSSKVEDEDDTKQQQKLKEEKWNLGEFQESAVENEFEFIFLHFPLDTATCYYFERLRERVECRGEMKVLNLDFDRWKCCEFSVCVDLT